jgi:hypothetical protein
MPNIPPLLSHRGAGDFGPNPSGRALFVNPANVSGGIVGGGGVVTLIPADEYLTITLSDLITPASQGDLYVNNQGVVSLVAGVGVNVSNVTAGVKQVSISGTNTSTFPHVSLATQAPFLHNIGTTLSFTNFPSQTVVPILQITTASAYNYCEFNYGWNPVLPSGNQVPAMASSNDTTAPMHFYLTPSLGVAYTSNTVFSPLVFPNVQSEGTTRLPTALQNAPAIFNSTNILSPARRMVAFSSTPSSNWYFVGSNSSPDAVPIPYIDPLTTQSMSYNVYLWNATLS